MRDFAVHRLGTGAALAFVALVSLGCPPDYAQTCRFDGDDAKPCGMCIASSCQSFVNACCDDKYSCLNDMGKVDTCGRGAGCSSLASTSSASGSKLKDIASCIASHCASVCGATGAASFGSPIVCTTTNLGCTCTSGSSTSPSAVVPSCSRDDVPASTSVAVCCASVGWPASGTQCTCRAYSSGCPVTMDTVSSCN